MCILTVPVMCIIMQGEPGEKGGQGEPGPQGPPASILLLRKSPVFFSVLLKYPYTSDSSPWKAE